MGHLDSSVDYLGSLVTLRDVRGHQSCNYIYDRISSRTRPHTFSLVPFIRKRLIYYCHCDKNAHLEKKKKSYKCLTVVNEVKSMQVVRQCAAHTRE